MINNKQICKLVKNEAETKAVVVVVVVENVLVLVAELSNIAIRDDDDDRAIE